MEATDQRVSILTSELLLSYFHGKVMTVPPSHRFSKCVFNCCALPTPSPSHNEEGWRSSVNGEVAVNFDTGCMNVQTEVAIKKEKELKQNCIGYRNTYI